MDPEKMSLAELRSEVKKVRTALYKPVSRSKKSDLVAELSRHKGVSSSASTKSESSVSTAPPEPEKARPKKVKEEKKEAPKKEKKEALKKEKKDDAGEVLSLKRKAKNEAEPPMPRKKAKMAKDE
jgi:hypothetical protein